MFEIYIHHAEALHFHVIMATYCRAGPLPRHQKCHIDTRILPGRAEIALSPRGALARAGRMARSRAKKRGRGE